jgi:hypothetical protein
MEQARGEKRPPRNGTGYHPHFVEYSRIVLCVMFKTNRTPLDKPTLPNRRKAALGKGTVFPRTSVRPYHIIHITGAANRLFLLSICRKMCFIGSKGAFLSASIGINVSELRRSGGWLGIRGGWSV